MNAWAVQFNEPVPYQQGLDLQHRLLKARQADEIPDTVLILQHTPTITLGNRGRDNYLLKTPEEYKALGIEVFHAERGGDVNNLTDEAVNEMLAMGLPAMSPSAGQTNIATILPAKNINISTLDVNGWPRNEQPYLQRWLHNDCRSMAYLYTFKLFEELITKGELK